MDESEVPAGFRLRHTLRSGGYSGSPIRIAWSPDGTRIASASDDRTVQIWDARTGDCFATIRVDWADVEIVSWSPDGKTLVAGGSHTAILLWDVEKQEFGRRLTGHQTRLDRVVWSPDGKFLAASVVGRVFIWDLETGQIVFSESFRPIDSLSWSPDGRFIALAERSFLGTVSLINFNDVLEKAGKMPQVLEDFSRPVIALAWSHNSSLLAAGSSDSTIGIWNAETGLKAFTVEGHTDAVIDVSFSHEGSFLASRSQDGTVRLWKTATWQEVARLPLAIDVFGLDLAQGQLSFNPRMSKLAILEPGHSQTKIWDIDFQILLNTISSNSRGSATYYTNSKIVLVGDSGVGKSGLGLVLSGAPFEPTPSTHGRKVWTFSSTETEVDSGQIEKRETLLWDLAGQPGYRLIHQLHLKEVVVALVVFDARSETDPFSGIQHWVRALKQAQIRGASHPIKKFLVAARTDRVGIAASRSRIESTLTEFGFDEYFSTSAKEGWEVHELAEAIRSSIDWNKLPKVSSNELFQEIKEFLIQEKQRGRLLCTGEDLYRGFCKSRDHLEDPGDLRPEFDLCIRLVEQRDLIRRLSFGGLVLLQSEFLDSYASAIVNAAKTEPDGLGSISEEAAKAGRFAISKDERIQDEEQEKLLLIATIEDLLRHEIALREHADDGPYLVFPSQLTRENKDLPDPEGKAVSLQFEGAVLNIYATLAVRLSHSGVFARREMWKNAATYTALTGGVCGMVLKEDGEGSGELTLFFDPVASKETRFQFEEYILVHLKRRALPESIVRRRAHSCTVCGTPVADLAVQRLQEQKRFTIDCYVCGNPVSLLDREERLEAIGPSLVVSMDKAADERRDTETAALVLQGKRETGAFDVFLCHNTEDKGQVKRIGELLQQQGILPWLDEWELRPGFPWQTILEEQIGKIRAAAVFVGPTGMGPWQNMELRSLLDEFVKRNSPVIPVILESCTKTPQLPRFLRDMTWVDFRQADPDPVEKLIWGITGERRSSLS